MHQKSTAIIAPMLSVKWVGFPQGTRALLQVIPFAFARGPVWCFLLKLEISIRSSLATDSFYKTWEGVEAQDFS